jgi:hypothetical protein
MNCKQQARKIYELCAVAVAPLTYGGVLEHLGYKPSASGNVIRYGLELVRIACASKCLPVLTAIVVNKSTRRPSDTALPHNLADWEAQVRKVLAHRDWPSVDEIDWNDVWENRRKLSADTGMPGYWTNK